MPDGEWISYDGSNVSHFFKPESSTSYCNAFWRRGRYGDNSRSKLEKRRCKSCEKSLGVTHTPADDLLRIEREIDKFSDQHGDERMWPHLSDAISSLAKVRAILAANPNQSHEEQND